MKMKSYFFILLAGSQTLAAKYNVVSKQVGSIQIPFVQNAEVEEKTYRLKASYADIEMLAPLSAFSMREIEPKDIRNLTMEEFNQLYARMGAGPMPYGDYSGYIMQKPPVYSAIKKRLLKQFMLADEFAKIAKLVCGREGDDCLLEFIWKGKRFGAKNSSDQIMAQTLVNTVSAGFKFPVFADIFKTKTVDKALNFAEGLIDKASLTFFPMNTYCGISQVDTRRESIITDASFGDDFGLPYYIGLRDEVVTRKGLNITEEYRMLRPGLYLGKVFTNKLFLFNVVLEKTGTNISQETKGECVDTVKAL